ncbi:MAG: ABC transporter permease [Thermogutta sp.]|nr:ABC transporter permease [Thermogutta sp.]HOP77996.1 ABC transporter permease [Thermogutta sp.]HPU07087.1 ABC transporter permease [Thermogutta sp.]HQF13892.1 ABC transporter permease [Thermogutta sp.]
MLLRFLIDRLIWLAITLWVVFTVSFFLMRAVPGGPLDRERRLDPQIEKNLAARYHLDEPVWQQYLRELGHVVQFDLGYSYRMADFTVNEVIAQGLPISAALGLAAMGLALTLGFAAGVASAAFRNSVLDRGLMVLATVGLAVPNFILAGVLIMLLVFVLPCFPAAGWGRPSHLVLPAVCLGLPYAASIARLTRTGLLEVLTQDYIRTARAKGLNQVTIIFKHALPGALAPVVSFLGPAVAGIITGSPVVEKIFAIPGLGMHFVEAALQRDYTLSMGLVLLFTLLLYGANVLVDLAYTILDPRVELQ